MASNLLIDTNVVLDAFLVREPFYETARKVLELNKRPDVMIAITASSTTDIFYLARRELKDRKVVKEMIINLVTEMSVKILPVTPEAIYHALNLPWADFEDAVQYSTALVNNMSGIVTRNVEDYKLSELDVYTPTAIVEFFNGK